MQGTYIITISTALARWSWFTGITLNDITSKKHFLMCRNNLGLQPTTDTHCKNYYSPPLREVLVGLVLLVHQEDPRVLQDQVFPDHHGHPKLREENTYYTLIRLNEVEITEHRIPTGLPGIPTRLMNGLPGGPGLPISPRTPGGPLIPGPPC